MSKSQRFSIVVVIIILASLVGVNLTQARQLGDPSSLSNATSHLANFPWSGQYVDSSFDPAINVGAYNSIAFRPYDDIPFISYYDATNGDLMLASPVPPGNGNCGVNGNWWCRAVDGDLPHGGGDVGQFSSIDIWGDSPTNWKLAISYYDATNAALKVAIWSCFLINCGWDISTVSSNLVNPGSNYNSLKFAPDGTLHIALNAGKLFYVTLINNITDGSIDDTWKIDLVDDVLGTALYASLDISWDGMPYIAYYDTTDGDLKLAYFDGSGNCFPSNGWTCIAIDGENSDVGYSASMVAPQHTGDSWSIAYYDKTNAKLKYVNNQLTPIIVDDMGSSNWTMSLSMAADKDGYPIISYQRIDLGSAQLLVARPYITFADGKYGNCGDLQPGYSHQYWRCNILDYSATHKSEADSVSVSINSLGLAEIAYSESDEYYGATSLKVLYQKYPTFLPLIVK
jgi:hypothetical protein